MKCIPSMQTDTKKITNGKQETVMKIETEIDNIGSVRYNQTGT